MPVGVLMYLPHKCINTYVVLHFTNLLKVLLGCLLPSSVQLANLGILEKNKEHEKEPSLLALSVPSIPFPMFCTFAHQTSTQKITPSSDVQQNIQVSLIFYFC